MPYLRANLAQNPLFLLLNGGKCVITICHSALEAAAAVVALALLESAQAFQAPALKAARSVSKVSMFSEDSRILSDASVWKNPVPLSEPGESPILIICCVSSPRGGAREPSYFVLTGRRST